MVKAHNEGRLHGKWLGHTLVGACAVGAAVGAAQLEWLRNVFAMLRGACAAGADGYNHMTIRALPSEACHVGGAEALRGSVSLYSVFVWPPSSIVRWGKSRHASSHGAQVRNDVRVTIIRAVSALVSLTAVECCLIMVTYYLSSVICAC